MKSFTRTGWWWLPLNADKRIYGTLSYSPHDGLELKVNGIFESSIEEELFSLSKTYPFILGIDSRGRCISLVDCRVSRLTMSGGNWEFTARPVFAFVGVHVDQSSQCRFRTVSVDYSGLLRWSGLRAFGHEVVSTEDKGGRHLVTEAREKIGPCCTTIGTVTISAGAAVQVSWHEASFKAVAHVFIQTGDALDLQEWMRVFIRPFQEFLCLSADHGVNIESLTTYFPSSDHHGIAMAEEPVDVFFHPLYYDDGTMPRDFLLTYQDISDEWCSILDRWLQVHQELKPVMNFLFGNFFRPAFVENRFINTIFAVEAYHRLRFQNRADPEDVHERRIAAIREAVLQGAPCHWPWLEKRLEYSNEPSLNRRIKDIIQHVRPVAEELLGNSEARKAFVRQVVATRNSLAHPEGKPKDGAITGGPALHWTTQRLAWLLKSCLLLEIGLDMDRVTKLVKRHPSFQNLASIPVDS